MANIYYVKWIHCVSCIVNSTFACQLEFTERKYHQFGAFLLPDHLAPGSEWANRTLAISFPGIFAPWPFRFLAHSLPSLFAQWPSYSLDFSLLGTKWPGNFRFPATVILIIIRSQERSLPRTLVCRVMSMTSDGTIYRIILNIAISRPYRGISLLRFTLQTKSIFYTTLIRNVATCCAKCCR